jgi:hypothetical protein
MSKIKTEFSKDCPDCGEIQYYGSKYSLANAIEKNIQCLTCSNKGQGFLDYGEMERICPQCKKTIYYKRRGTFLMAIRKNSTCKPCSYERRKKPIKEKKIKDEKYYQNLIEKRITYKKKWREENKEVLKIKSKKWREENKEVLKIKSKKWREENKETISKKSKISYQNNKEKRKEQVKKYRESPKGKEVIRKRSLLPKNKLNNNISKSIGQSINLFSRNKNLRKSGRHWENITGYTIEQLMIHLEKQFTQGMNWDNYGKGGWELEHIIPVSFFDFSYIEDIEFKYCWSLNNLQPLWRKDNLEKGDKITFWGRKVNAKSIYITGTTQLKVIPVIPNS